MAKHIKRFSTYNEYKAYVADSSFEGPLVSVCDDMVESGDEYLKFSGIYQGDTTTGVIYVKLPDSISAITVYITNEHEILDTITVGEHYRMKSPENNILGGISDSNSYKTYEMPYYPGAYYGFHIVSIAGNTTPWYIDIRPDVNDDTDITYFYDDYASGRSPYNISGYPDNYTGPTIEVEVSEYNELTSGYQYYTINGNPIEIGDTVTLPVKEGYTLLPGSTIRIIRVEPE